MTAGILCMGLLAGCGSDNAANTNVTGTDAATVNKDDAKEVSGSERSKGSWKRDVIKRKWFINTKHVKGYLTQYHRFGIILPRYLPLHWIF